MTKRSWCSAPPPGGRAAVELQAGLLQATRSAPDLPLPVGIGLDAGEAVPVESGFRGGALNLAARLCGEAGPGEILASQSLVHLARAVEGVRYDDRGELHLKGLSDPVHVLAIASEDERRRGADPSAAPREPARTVYGGRMQFRVLGPLEVDAGGGPIPLGGPKQRAVLAHLLVRANQLVPADTLVDEIWGEEPPDQARNIIQTYVSHLRKALGRDRIQSQAPGYRLRLDRLRAGRRTVRRPHEGREEDPPRRSTIAVGTLDDALALWRGRLSPTSPTSLPSSPRPLGSMSFGSRPGGQDRRLAGGRCRGPSHRGTGGPAGAASMARKPLGPPDAGVLPRRAPG